MLELNHGHIVTVASSLGLFSTAGVEVSIIHNDTYTSRRSHHPKPVLLSKALSMPASTLGRGRWGPLSLVLPPPVKLRDADEHWGALIDSSICSSGVLGHYWVLAPEARMSWQLPKGQRHLHHCFVKNLVLTQYSAHSNFQWIRFWFSFLSPPPPVKILFVILMHIKIFSGVIYLHKHRGIKLVSFLGFILRFQRTEFSFIPVPDNSVYLKSSTGTTTPFVFCFYSCTFALVVQAFIHNDQELKSVFVKTSYAVIASVISDVHVNFRDLKPLPVTWAQSSLFILPMFMDVHLCLPKQTFF